MDDSDTNATFRQAVALALLRDQLRPGTAARVAKSAPRSEDGGPRIGNGPDALSSLAGLARPERQALASFSEWDAVDREIERARTLGVTLMPLTHPSYPPLLAEIHDPPALLYLRGDLTDGDRHALAIVGSRHASRYGLSAARGFAKQLARAGLTIVSGLAHGIDQAAHEGALEAEGRTVAVLGCGIDVDYPARGGALRDRIAARGAVLSEFPFGTVPFKSNFPVRNRVVSGLARGVLVVEAARSSGSLITARAALDQGREVFAVPGPIDQQSFAGCIDLLRQGAHVAGAPSHILEDLKLDGGTLELPLAAPAAALPPRQLSTRETAARQVLAAIALTPVTFDALLARTGLDPTAAAAVLLDLELDGLVLRSSDGTYTAHDPFAG